MRTALYLRVSTIHQKPDLQSDGLRGYATHAGLEIVAEYLDVAVSGRKEGRPKLQALMRAARSHELDCVLVWKFDRFARSVAHLLNALDEFHHLGIRFISVQDQVDTGSPMGKAMFTIIGAIAELESSLISERVKAGMEAAQTRGKRLGRPTTPTHLVSRIEEFAETTDMSIRQIQETVVKTPGLSSPCTMECGEGLLTAFGVSFTPHIQRQTRPDLLLCPHPIHTLLHLAIAPVAPFHGIRGGGQQLVIEKRQGFFQGGRKELLECLAQLGEPQEPPS